MFKEKVELHHIIEAQQFSRLWLEQEFFPESKEMKFIMDRLGRSVLLSDKSICLLFYEPSTRTRLSFDQAGQILGARVVATESAKEFSSAIKGESLIDTIRVVNALRFDAIVLRSDYEGGAKDAVGVSKIPVINAGDGPGQHPTQALLDVYTIKQHFNTIDGLRVALVGDLLNGRTTRSLAYLLGKFNDIHISLVAPDKFQMRGDILSYLDRHHVHYRQSDDLANVVHEVDVIYLTRLQKERLGENECSINGKGVMVDPSIMELLPSSSIIMHPLPRSNDFNELPEELTNDPRVKIFEQVENGLYTRMALLKMIMGR